VKTTKAKPVKHTSKKHATAKKTSHKAKSTQHTKAKV
jgi:hypothetical protein